MLSIQILSWNSFKNLESFWKVFKIKWIDFLTLLHLVAFVTLNVNKMMQSHDDCVNICIVLYKKGSKRYWNIWAIKC